VLSKELQPKDYLRLLMVYFSVFELSQKDKDTMLKSVGKESFKEIVRNFELLDHERCDSGKFRRRLPEQSSEDFNDYLRRHSQAQFDILKCSCKIVKLLRQMHDATLDQTEYPYFKDKPLNQTKLGTA